MPENKPNRHAVLSSAQARQLLSGAGAAVARWVHPNHCEEWDEERDGQVLKRSKETAKQFPGFAKRMSEQIHRVPESPR